MRLLFAPLVLALVAAGCHPHPRPPHPGDSTSVDTTGIDTTGLDTLRQEVAPADNDRGSDSVREITPADTLIQKTARVAARGAGIGGTPFGLSQWPTSAWCSGPFSAVMDGVTPELLGGTVRAALRCGMHVVVVGPRRLMTANGETVGLYRTDKATQLCRDYVRAFPAESLTKYTANGTIIGFSLGDDFTNPDVWGGQEITPGTFATVMTACKSAFPASVPLGARQTPAYISGSLVLARTIDFAWLQYLTKRGTPKDFYSKGQAIADRFGFKTIRGVNVHSCHAAGADDPCSASELRQFLTEALNPTGYGAGCASLSWRYDTQDYTTDRRAVYVTLATLAVSRPAASCHR